MSKRDGVIPRCWAIWGLLALATPALAAGTPMQWQVRDGDPGPLLAWEQPDTDNQPLLFACDVSRRVLGISLVHEPAEARDGMMVQTEWSSEAGQARFAMRGQRVELDDLFILTAETALTPDFARLLSAGRTLTIRIAGRVETIPLDGAAAGVARLRRRCGAR